MPYQPRNIIVCADGTWSEPARKEGVTNVVRLARSIQSVAPGGASQIIYYHKGVGEQGGLVDRLTGGAFGAGLSSIIKDIYIFLVNNYVHGDKLYFFGYSRGAYAVRSVVGMIRNVGILRPAYLDHYEEAYSIYRSRDEEHHPRDLWCEGWRMRHSQPRSRIHFMGVWDTVGALGIPVTPLRFWTKKYYEFHDLDLSSHVRYAYQALSIDEKRRPFRPALWQKQSTTMESQTLEQAWFPGTHANIGGGASDAGLSDGALLWMWDRAEKAGLFLNNTRKPRPDFAAPMENSLTPAYRLLGTHIRRPGDTTEQERCETLHHSTKKRMEATELKDPRQYPYRPRNIKRFLAQNPEISEP